MSVTKSRNRVQLIAAMIGTLPGKKCMNKKLKATVPISKLLQIPKINENSLALVSSLCMCPLRRTFAIIKTDKDKTTIPPIIAIRFSIIYFPL